MRRTKKVACAWMSLMLEKHADFNNFKLSDILFTRPEIHQRTEKIFNISISDYVIIQATVDGAETAKDKFFIRGQDNEYYHYYWLCCPEDYSGYDVDELVQGLLDSGWNNRTPYKTKDQIIGVLLNYYYFLRHMELPVQNEEPEIISREAAWLAVALLTYNDYYRTKSRDPLIYQYPQVIVGILAHSFNTRNTKDTCATMAWNTCTVGRGEQPWSYFVNTGGVRRDSRRRLSYYGEFEYTQPDLHEDFIVNTVNGPITVKKLEKFINNVYSPIFYKRLIPPLDESYSVEQREKHALELDYESLRAAAVGRGELYPENRPVTTARYIRDPYISVYARRRARGVCQLCCQNAPFENSNGEPYLESHHIIWLSQGGADAVDNVVALCPNCHRKMHIVNDEDDVAFLQKLVISGK